MYFYTVEDKPTVISVPKQAGIFQSLRDNNLLVTDRHTTIKYTTLS